MNGIDTAGPALVTLIENAHGSTAKEFRLAADCSLKKTSAAQIFEGTARRIEVPDLEAFSGLLEALKTNQALTFGITKNAPAKIVTQSMLKRGGKPDAVARHPARPGRTPASGVRGQ